MIGNQYEVGTIKERRNNKYEKQCETTRSKSPRTPLILEDHKNYRKTTYK